MVKIAIHTGPNLQIYIVIWTIPQKRNGPKLRTTTVIFDGSKLQSNLNFGGSKIKVLNRNFGQSKITVPNSYFIRSKITFHNCTFGRFKITAHNFNFGQPNETLVQIYGDISFIWRSKKIE